MGNIAISYKNYYVEVLRNKIKIQTRWNCQMKVEGDERVSAVSRYIEYIINSRSIIGRGGRKRNGILPYPVLIIRQKYWEMRQMLAGQMRLCGCSMLPMFKGGSRWDSAVCVPLPRVVSLFALMPTNSDRPSDVGWESLWEVSLGPV